MVPFLPLLLAVTVGQSGAQRPPPNYSPDALPETSFSCRGRQPGGYYADVEAGCQMFHVCGSGQGPSFRFLCPNDTVFDQQNLICANWFEVVCELDSVLHARNFEIFKTHSNKETAFNVLHEDDLPELDDYEYDTGFSAGQSSLPAAPRFSSQRATTTARPVNRFDQFVAASTARPVIVTAPNVARMERQHRHRDDHRTTQTPAEGERAGQGC
ncbi:hypothetical protein FJT64_018999 [Amphibalanus amphitrite]|uniref:Chitin-binding type-2 domain-containing protein n=1 Tax=Amphibalanus amphitrite TaxID=1232801 RepID=A0A6A4WV69_AMPAM|nr:hypothetical protein FJT64_018999 [Amphibalanus amphitrite]